MTVWIVTPVYRDVPSFRVLRRRLLEVLAEDPHTPHEPGSVEFVVIDDTAGQDPSIELLRELDDVVVLQPPFNLGHQRAIVYGLRKALPAVCDDDLVVTLDADGEDRPEDLPRLLTQLHGELETPTRVVLAVRTKRKESLRFRVLYRCFRVLFRVLTGTTVQTGNFAVMPGAVAKKLILHPTFDLSYSSTLLALDVPRVYVPCERGERFEGKSKMTFGRLGMHGLRMLMPFTDRIAIRALALFVVSLVLGASLAVVVVAIRLFTNAAIPGWATFTVLGALIISLVALGNFVTLFVLFSQSRAVSLAAIEDVTNDHVERVATARHRASSAVPERTSD